MLPATLLRKNLTKKYPPLIYKANDRGLIKIMIFNEGRSVKEGSINATKFSYDREVYNIFTFNCSNFKQNGTIGTISL
jgi:hypothetical protein